MSDLGWLYLNPDTGIEWSEQHPVVSGEVSDAEDVREATGRELLDLLLDAWSQLDDARAALAMASAALDTHNQTEGSDV